VFAQAVVLAGPPTCGIRLVGVYAERSWRFGQPAKARPRLTVRHRITLTAPER
jgi:hypothetical protein